MPKRFFFVVLFHYLIREIYFKTAALWWEIEEDF